MCLLPSHHLQQLYTHYLAGHHAQPCSPQDYIQRLNALKQALLRRDPRDNVGTCEDRCPKLYFQLKAHKQAFQDSLHTTRATQVYFFTLTPHLMTPLLRPIVNHSHSITALCSAYLRRHTTPLLADSTFLTQDIFDTLARRKGSTRRTLSNSTPPPLTGPSWGPFYMLHFFPQQTRSFQLLCGLLRFNFATDGHHTYNLGTIGIPTTPTSPSSTPSMRLPSRRTISPKMRTIFRLDPLG